MGGQDGFSKGCHLPSNGALFASSGGLVSLALNAKIHDVIAADCTIVDHNIPRPQRYLQAVSVNLPFLLRGLSRSISP